MSKPQVVFKRPNYPLIFILIDRYEVNLARYPGGRGGEGRWAATVFIRLNEPGVVANCLTAESAYCSLDAVTALLTELGHGEEIWLDDPTRPADRTESDPDRDGGAAANPRAPRGPGRRRQKRASR